jgi:hypothetical protein
MYNGHFRQCVSDRHTDKCTDQVRDDNARASELDRYAAAEKKTDSDCATHGNHGELSLREPALKTLFLHPFGSALGLVYDMHLFVSYRKTVSMAMRYCAGTMS